MAEVMIALGVFLLGFLVFWPSVFLVRRFVNFSVLEPNNETVPHYLSIVIGLYGIFSGFVIASLWEQQRQAEDNISAEPRAFQLAQERMEFDLRTHTPARALQSAGGNEVLP